MSSEESRRLHRYDDLDFDSKSHHHTLGTGPFQAAAGNHNHVNLVDTGWINFPLPLNGWNVTAGRTPGYRKIGFIVYLRGTLWGGASGTVAFVLPTGFRPGIFSSFVTPGSAANLSCALNIDTFGQGSIHFSSGTNAGLDGVNFVADL